MNSGENLNKKSSGLGKAKYVFNEFSKYYQERWTDKLRDDAARVSVAKAWGEILDEFTMEAIKDVINDIRSGKNKFCSFIPLQGEFAQLCREKNNPCKLFLSESEAESLLQEKKWLSDRVEAMLKEAVQQNTSQALTDYYCISQRFYARIAFIEMALQRVRQ
jgi:hypothetical protein